MTVSDQKLVDLGNQLMCLVSEKTQMPLCAITAKFAVGDAEKRVVLSLALKDHCGNIWTGNGKGALEDACHHNLTHIALKRFQLKYQQPGVFDVVYTSVEELQAIKLIDATKLHNTIATQLCDFYIQQHNPPTYEGFLHIHEHLRTYMQGECVYYAIALSDLIKKPICSIQIGNAVHYAVRHDNGDVEDIWGKRSVSNVVTDFTNSAQKPTVAAVDTGSVALLKSVSFGDINKAKRVVKSNPRHKFNAPVQLSHPTP